MSLFWVQSHQFYKLHSRYINLSKEFCPYKAPNSCVVPNVNNTIPNSKLLWTNYKIICWIVEMIGMNWMKQSKWQIWYQKFLAEFNRFVNYYSSNRREILESLLSEKDSQIALLEVFGAKSQQQVERLDILRSDRSRLNQRLKVEVNRTMDQN